MEEVCIIAARRTPTGNLLGDLSAVSAADLGGCAIRAALSDCGIRAEEIDEALMGCVLPAAQGQAPARQAAFAGGLPPSVPCATINKMCGSGMKAAMIGADSIRLGESKITVAGGMESMSNAPHLIKGLRRGFRMGDVCLADHMFADGLQDAYENKLMGVYAQRTADKYKFSREQMDDFAINSVERAQASQRGGTDANEIIPVTIKSKKGEDIISDDEQPRKSDIKKIRALKPAFRSDGTVTAANSSSISDGAASLVLAAKQEAKKRGIKSLAQIIGHATYARPPDEFTIAPIDAIRALLNKVGWKIDSVDLFEINEAFAAVTMAAMRDLAISDSRVNVLGGACARGHPVGASGARIIVTLLNALKLRGGGRGVASLCIGGGEATAIAIEMREE